MTNADQDPSKLLSDVESLCQLGCDVICVRGITDDSMTPIQEACKEAGIPLIALSVVDQDGEYLFFAAIQRKLALLLVQSGMRNIFRITRNRNTMLALLLVTIPSKQLFADGLMLGTLMEVTNLPMVKPTGGAPNAMTLVEDWIKTYPEMNVIGSSSDEMTVGVIQALQDAGKSPDDYIVMSYDALDIMQDYILEGWCDASVGLDLEKHARTVCDILQKVKDGDTSSVEKTDEGLLHLMCTSENLQDIL